MSTIWPPWGSTMWFTLSGVLHHTGNVWAAIAKAAGLVRAGALFVIGIYDYLEGRLGTATWAKMKRWY